MNILYCGDNNITDGLIISILSLLKNIKEKLNIYVLTMELVTENKTYNAISNASIDYLDKIVKSKNEKSFVKKIDITNMYKEELPIKNMETRFTPYCMVRLFADKIQEIPDRILYLDTDVICRKDCLEFYNQDIENYELVGVLDFYGSHFFRNNIFKKDYLNSGVLLLNMKKIKATKLFENCRKKCIEEEMFMPDQSAINKLTTAKKIMPRKYNEQRRLHKNTVFQHFTTSFRLFPLFHTVTIKPWNIEELHSKLKIKEYDDILNEYIKIKQNIDTQNTQIYINT
ncbi:MAG: glycosyltransferase family 8 protein [Clostridia bacterium]|nr:glycosyltransferase family 8 protein [Clostridia bacterium]